MMARRNAWVLILAGVVLAAPAAWAEEGELEAMRRRVEQMDRDLAEVRARVNEQTAQIAQQQEQIRAYETAQAQPTSPAASNAALQQVLTDAQRRSQLLATTNKLSAGYNNGFFITSGEAFTLRIRGLLMARYTHSEQKDSPTDDSRGGFELARTRFGFFGSVIDPSWQFVLWTGYANDASTTLLDTYIRKTYSSGLQITAGQYKMPFWREWLISETRLPLAERSLLNRFSGSYVQGLMVGYEKDRLHAYLSASDGLASSNTSALTPDVEGAALTGRIEWLASGQWTQYTDTEAWPGENTLLAFGVAAHYQQGEYGTAADEPEIFRWTVDSTLKRGRFSVMGAVVGNHQEASVNLDQYGFLGQVGYFVTKDTEAHVRYEWGDSDIDGDAELSIITIGIDHHWIKHQMRHIIDIGYAFNSVSAFWANPLPGYRADEAGDDGQIVIRTQLELSF